MKKYCDEGKFAAPRWLVYPELSAWTIGWRMGYGEEYALNEPPRPKEFYDIFPKPRNWLFNPRKSRVTPIPLMGFLWRDDGKPKYDEIDDDYIPVDFMAIGDEEEFRQDSFRFQSVEHAVLMSKYFSYNKCGRDADLDDLRKGFDLAPEELENWEFFRYTVLLNACYYKIMQDPKLKKKLLSTGNRSLKSDDEDNLLGFALMELRDELKRLYEHEDLIDWQFTEYLKDKNPYENYRPRDIEDQQSPEYRIFEQILYNSKRYVRDVNLDLELASRYEPGMIITEKAFVDASDKIGGMATSHRYLILSSFMADLSRFETETNWSIHTAKNNSRFKVLDVYEVDGKTQIILLHLPEGFGEVFENSPRMESERVEELRQDFIKDLKKEVVKDLTDSMWLERCSFPVGMDDDGNFF